MALRTQLAGWWSAWKYVLLLSLLLVASVWLNVVQYGQRRAAKAEARAEVLEETLKTTAGIARDAQADNVGLLKELEVIAERGRKERLVYRKAAALKPMDANCAPGQERVDAVNQGLGPIIPE